MSRDEQIKKLATEMRDACLIQTATTPWDYPWQQDDIVAAALLPYATSLVEKDEEIARLKEKLGIAEGALEEIAGDVYQPTDFAHVSTAREALSALAAIREKAGKE